MKPKNTKIRLRLRWPQKKMMICSAGSKCFLYKSMVHCAKHEKTKCWEQPCLSNAKCVPVKVKK